MRSSQGSEVSPLDQGPVFWKQLSKPGPAPPPQVPRHTHREREPSRRKMTACGRRETRWVRRTDREHLGGRGHSREEHRRPAKRAGQRAQQRLRRLHAACGRIQGASGEKRAGNADVCGGKTQLDPHRGQARGPGRDAHSWCRVHTGKLGARARVHRSSPRGHRQGRKDACPEEHGHTASPEERDARRKKRAEGGWRAGDGAWGGGSPEGLGVAVAMRPQQGRRQRNGLGGASRETHSEF